MIRAFVLLAVLNGLLVSQLPLWKPQGAPPSKPARGGKRAKAWALARADAPAVLDTARDNG